MTGAKGKLLDETIFRKGSEQAASAVYLKRFINLAGILTHLFVKKINSINLKHFTFIPSRQKDPFGDHLDISF